MSRERPILFSSPMVRAILAGRKTQTRRIVKPQPYENGRPEHWSISKFSQFSPYGQPGDRLWVRESFWGCDIPGYGDQPCVVYDDEWHGNEYAPAEARPWGRKFGRIPSIHMPRDCSRIDLEITAVRVERLQDIGESDAIAEGAQRFNDIPAGSPVAHGNRWSMESPASTDECLSTARFAFFNLFCKLNGKGKRGVIDFQPWEANPLVWVVEFRRAA